MAFLWPSIAKETISERVYNQPSHHHTEGQVSRLAISSIRRIIYPIIVFSEMPTYNIQIGVQNEPISQTYIGVGRVDLKFPDDVTQATIGPNTTVELDFSGMSPPFTLERL